MLECQKHLFKLPSGQSYLNCAYKAPLSKAMMAAAMEALTISENPANYQPKDFFDPLTQIKAAFADIIHAPRDRIALIPSVSYGMANVANNVQLKANQHILLAGLQFPSNYYPWQQLARKYGAQLRIIDPPNSHSSKAQSWNEQLLAAMDSSTAMVAISQVHWADGSRFDLHALRRRSREVGALLIVDGTQSVGAMPFDVEEIQPDALICAGYKWLFGPFGLGLAYYGPPFDNGVPIEESWMNRLNREDFTTLVNYQDQYKPLAARYNVGEQSHFVLLPILQTALQHLIEWQVERIQQYCARLTEPAIEAFRTMGCVVEDAHWRGAHLFGIRLPKSLDISRLQDELRAARVIVSVRGDALRVSPNVYNDQEDIDQLVSCVAKSLTAVNL